MRVFHHVQRAQADGFQQLAYARLEFYPIRDQAMFLKRFTHNVFHNPARVQRCVRVLKNHLDASAQRRRLGRLEHRMGILTIEGQAAPGRLIQAHQQACHGTFAASGLTHQGQRLAFFDVKADPVHGLQHQPGFTLQYPVQPGR